ncbi:MAG: hypothetical protein DRH26_03475 [Deltaproteobacteria bacterium]|nr:MAG: hypothetical protein DRH26_03475 [Deltaproteobacteria bacterium]
MVKKKKIKTKIVPPVKSQRGIERQYRKQLNKLGKALILAVRTDVLAYLKANQAAYTMDGVGDQLGVIFEQLSGKFLGTATASFAKETASTMVSKVTSTNKSKFDRSVARAIGVDLGSVVQTEGLEDLLTLSKKKNEVLIKSLPEEYLKQVETIVNNGVVSGARYETIAKEITAKTGANSKLAGRIKTIAMNEVQTINSQITLRRSDSLGITEGIFRTSEDERVRTCHKELNGIKYLLREGAWSKTCGKFILPGITDINCFPGESELNHISFCEKLFRRWYTGELIEIVFSDNSSFAVTPNHPIFTTAGRKPAHVVEIGDNIIRTPQKSFDIAKHNSQSMIPIIEELFNSFELFGVKPTISPSIGGKFHGDFSDSDIDIINIDSLLMDKLNASVAQKIAELNFTRPDEIRKLKLFTCDSSGFDSIPGSWLSSDSIMSFFDLVKSRLLVHLTPLELFGFALGAWGNSNLKQSFSNNTSGNSKMFRDCIFAFSVLVHGLEAFKIKLDNITFNPVGIFNPMLFQFPVQGFGMDSNLNSDDLNRDTILYKADSVIDTFSRNFSGHIYNLQTVSGDYIVNTSAMSNCRCTYSPIIEVQ